MLGSPDASCCNDLDLPPLFVNHLPHNFGCLSLLDKSSYPLRNLRNISIFVILDSEATVSFIEVMEGENAEESTG